MLRQAQAITLQSALNDQFLRESLQEFFSQQAGMEMQALHTAVLKGTRDIHKESRIAGAIDAYQSGFSQLEEFARRSIQEAVE